jgi:UDPglucose 6-dehydrogenase
MDVCIIGTGYVGLVAAACFAEMGNSVTCIDVNKDLIDQLNAGKIHIYEPGLEPLVARNTAEGRLTFSTDLPEGMEKALFVFICVGTPSQANGACDLCHVDQVAERIGQTLSDYKIIINKSTVPVGTADRVKDTIQAGIRERGLQVEFDVVSNPEFLKEGDAVNDFLKPDRVIVGTDNIRTAKLLETLYAPFARSRDKMIVMGIRSAEITKYTANCMLATKISFMNEVANICESVGADVKEVRVGIASDRRIGYHFIYPGVGYGGSCFPKDVRALANTAKENGCQPTLVEAVDIVNNRQKRLMANKIINFFESHNGNGVKGKTLAFWGLAFKANTDDMRESAALDIIEVLTDAGMRIRAYDPVAGKNGRNLMADNALVEVMDNQYDPIDGADALAVVTDWNQFRNPDFHRIAKSLNSPVVFDGRNLYSRSFLNDLGFSYICVGRQSVINQGRS